MEAQARAFGGMFRDGTKRHLYSDEDERALLASNESTAGSASAASDMFARTILDGAYTDEDGLMRARDGRILV